MQSIMVIKHRTVGVGITPHLFPGTPLHKYIIKIILVTFFLTPIAFYENISHIKLMKGRSISL